MLPDNMIQNSMMILSLMKIKLNNKNNNMKKIKKFNENNAGSVFFADSINLLMSYEDLLLDLFPTAIEKYNRVHINDESKKLDMRECEPYKAYGDDKNLSIYYEFTDEYGNDYNIELTEEDFL